MPLQTQPSQGGPPLKPKKQFGGGEGQHFLEQNLEKRGKARIFLVVTFERTKKIFLNTFSQGFNFYLHFVFFFSTVGISLWINFITDNIKYQIMFFWVSFCWFNFFQLPVIYGTFYLIHANLTFQDLYPISFTFYLLQRYNTTEKENTCYMPLFRS